MSPYRNYERNYQEGSWPHDYLTDDAIVDADFLATSIRANAMVKESQRGHSNQATQAPSFASGIEFRSPWDEFMSDTSEAASSLESSDQPSLNNAQVTMPDRSRDMYPWEFPQTRPHQSSPLTQTADFDFDITQAIESIPSTFGSSLDSSGLANPTLLDVAGLETISPEISSNHLITDDLLVDTAHSPWNYALGGAWPIVQQPQVQQVMTMPQRPPQSLPSGRLGHQHQQLPRPQYNISPVMPWDYIPASRASHHQPSRPARQDHFRIGVSQAVLEADARQLASPNFHSENNAQSAQSAQVRRTQLGFANRYGWC
ncbi:hypothetical protein BX600DRAFT_536699 [Xylariales sp. PMI_506]|nr:hypothetical protein BX600DRAFT_536699 [Xylariales sp. PMI_506]